MTTTERLLPCPFCGNRNVAQGSSGDYISVWCGCGARGPDVPFPEIGDPLPPILECHAKWNTRALSSTLEAPAGVREVAERVLRQVELHQDDIKIEPWERKLLKDYISQALFAHGTAQRAAGVEAAAKVAERHIYKGGYGVQYPAGIEAEIAAAIRSIRPDDGEGTK